MCIKDGTDLCWGHTFSTSDRQHSSPKLQGKCLVFGRWNGRTYHTPNRLTMLQYVQQRCKWLHANFSSKIRREQIGPCSLPVSWICEWIKEWSITQSINQSMGVLFWGTSGDCTCLRSISQLSYNHFIPIVEPCAIILFFSCLQFALLRAHTPSSGGLLLGTV